jgi:hypothetical protein
MGRLFADTAQIVEDELIARLRGVPPQRKLAMVAQLNAAVREMMMAGLRRQHPDESPEQLRQRMARALLGPELSPHVHQLPKGIQTMLSEPVEVMLAVADTFEGMKITYVIGGSMASAFYGVSRSTLDVDFVADVRPEHITVLAEALRPDFYLDEGMIRAAIEQRGSFNLIHLPTMFKVDVFIPGERNFDKLQLGRRIPASLTPEPVRQAYLLTPEDVVLAKLDWYRLGGEVSDRQWGDILGVLAVQAGRLDVAYMQDQAQELGIQTLLEKALLESNY